jgi:general secretion pathway protein A
MQVDLRSVAKDAFGVTPDTRFLFMSRSHREALASLVHGIDCDRPFIALIGKPGTGKTTLLFRLLQHYRNTARTAFIFQTQCNSRELLRYLLTDCGVDCTGQDVVSMHSQFNQLLIDTHRTGKRFLIFLDEAHNFRHDILEAIRLLSDFETPQKKLLQIIFSGQPAIDEELSRPDMVQLRQRIPLFCRLEPLAKDETFKYIAHRLKIVGAHPELFTPISMEMIYDLTSGLPRDIHNLCFGALSLACAVGAEQVDSSMIAEAAHDLRWEFKSGYEEPTKTSAAVASAISMASSQVLEESAATTPIEPVLCSSEIAQPDVRADPEFYRAEPTPVVLKTHGSGSESKAEAEKFRQLLLDPSHGKVSAKTSGKAESLNKRKRTALIVGGACVLIVLGVGMLEPSRRLIASSENMLTASAARLLKEEPATAPDAVPTVHESKAAEPPTKAVPKKTARRTGTTRKPPPVIDDSTDVRWISVVPSDTNLAVTVTAPEGAPPHEVDIGEPESNLGSTIASVSTLPRRQSQITQSRLIEAPEPVYPEAAKRTGVTGVVELAAIIDTNGRLKDIRVVSGNPLLNDAAIEAAKLQRYTPYLMNSQPKEVPTRVRFVFRDAAQGKEK